MPSVWRRILASSHLSMLEEKQILVRKFFGRFPRGILVTRYSNLRGVLHGETSLSRYDHRQSYTLINLQ